MIQTPPAPEQPHTPHSNQSWKDLLHLLLAITALGVLGFSAWSNALHSPLLLDDIETIRDNATLRSIGTSLTEKPPTGAGVAGRPIANLSYALDRAIGGAGVTPHHVSNVLIHIASSVLLLLIARRTLLLSGLGFQSAAKTTAAAFLAAALWLLHPIQTQSVTYISQRTELLAGFFYLATLYCYARGAQDRAAGWSSAAIALCALGMASKETMVTAPVVIALYDRLFLTGSWRETLMRRGPWLVGLAATWGILAALIWQSKLEARQVGFGLGVGWWEYGITEVRALVLYLSRIVWPHPLIFDHGAEIIREPAAVLPHAAALALVLSAALFAFVRRPALGFGALWFFLLIAPSSSVVPIVGQPVAESRVYLPLAGFCVLGAAILGRLMPKAFWPILALALAGAWWGTHQRNETYRNEFALWKDTATKKPTNARAHLQLGGILLKEGKLDEAKISFETTLALDPSSYQAHNNLGAVFVQQGRLEEAIRSFREALQHPSPMRADIHTNLGNLLARASRFDEAAEDLRQALMLEPDRADARLSLATIAAIRGQHDVAATEFTRLLERHPSHREALMGLGTALSKIPGREKDSLAAFSRTLEATPGDAIAHFRMGEVLNKLKRHEEAIASMKESIRLAPQIPDLHNGLGIAYAQTGRFQEAIQCIETAVRLQPGNKAFQDNLTLAKKLAEGNR